MKEALIDINFEIFYYLLNINANGGSMESRKSLSLKVLNAFWVLTAKKDQKNLSSKTPITGITEFLNIPYADDSDTDHLLDIYIPEGLKKPYKTIFDIHGGGWMYGNKELNKHYCKDLAKRGFAVIGINYHLFPSCTLPIPIQDIFMAFNWVLKEGEKYGLDLTNLFLTGDSAGAHYSALSLSILGDKTLCELFGVSSKIEFKGVGFTCGAFDVEAIAKIKLPLAQEYIRLFFGEKKYKNHRFYKCLTIKNNKLENFPPIFMSSSYGDFIKSNTINLASELDKKNIPYSLHFVEKYQRLEKDKSLTHVYNVLYPEWKDSKLVNDKMCDFFKKL